MLHRARSLLSGELEPVPPRAAATVALIRDGAGGPEVYLLRRRPKLAFAAGMYVFPGGSVDASDLEQRTPDAPWAGPGPKIWAGWFGTDERTAAGLVRAAVRETFEEAGVLLASSVSENPATASAAPLPGDPATSSIIGNRPTTEVSETERADLEAGRISLRDLLIRHALVLRADRMAPLQHWITPELEQRRFDTRFFVAALPPGQEPREAGTEADLRVWLRPAEALRADLTLMPPTRAALSELARYATVAEALAAEREIRVVQPGFEVVGDRVRIVRD
ncbi:hypothetical protein GCM10027456_50620 [Kineosporia babensis]